MSKALKLAKEIATKYSKSDQVVAIALAGSQSTNNNDLFSDIDLYVYSNQELSLNFRKTVAFEGSKKIEVDNNFWESGDEWIDIKTGIKVDVMFRINSWIEEKLHRVLYNYEASTGYSTCFWYNVLHSIILVDKEGWFANLKNNVNVIYPLELKKAIIEKNFPILGKNNSCYVNQIELALNRKDAISVQHRITEFLASYFDIIFAINELPHPGEKRLLIHVEKACAKIPDEFFNLMNDLLGSISSNNEQIVTITKKVVDSLTILLRNENLLDDSD